MGDAIPALTLWQPWASLIAAGCKPFEFRRWEAPRWVHGKRIAIHAGARKVKREEVQELLVRLQTDGGFGTGLTVGPAIALLDRALSAPGMLPLSAVVCTAVLGRPVRAAELVAAGDSDRVDHHVWGWPLTDVRVLAPYVPARGAQGFWIWTPPAEVRDA